MAADRLLGDRKDHADPVLASPAAGASLTIGLY
jgi:hypothetical protein